MGVRPLLAVAAVVSVLHAALLLVLARHGPTPAVARTSRPEARWIVLAAAQREGAAAVSAAAAPGKSMAAQRGQSRSLAAEGASGTAAQTSSTTRATPAADRSAAIGVYRAATALDVPVRARSAPDMGLLAGLSWSGLPLRLRLFIDDQGNVVEARILQSAESDDVAERVRRMFLATGFTPGVEGGRPVPSYKDIEMTIGTPS